jgi:inner membrane protein involved in colicin E2 resistance
MTAVSLLETALLLGLYVALAGAYGLVYAIVRLKGAAALRGLPVMIYALHAGAALAIVLWTPLDIGWKGLIVASSIAFLAIPPITWRFLRHTHETEA